MPEVKAVPWQHSEAKKILTSDILDGTTTADMSARQVFATREELYAPYKKNFSTNLRNLRKSLKSLQDRADEDQEAVLHDLEAFPRSTVNARGHRRFDGSEAQRLLKHTFDNGEDEGLLPKEIWLTRLEYQGHAANQYSLQDTRKEKIPTTGFQWFSCVPRSCDPVYYVTS
jgi:hypothetical protein